MKLLVHICCAHCLAQTLTGLRHAYGDALEVYGLFYNPNIHPLLEFRRRLKSVRVYVERDPIPLILDETYGLVPFCERVHPDYTTAARCRRCYGLRFARAAAEAVKLGAEAFTSTLITSQHQDHALIRAVGDEEATRLGTTFLYQDLRGVVVPAGELQGLYRQQYCGCVFSEAERFRDSRQHLYRGR